MWAGLELQLVRSLLQRWPPSISPTDQASPKCVAPETHTCDADGHTFVMIGSSGQSQEAMEGRTVGGGEVASEVVVDIMIAKGRVYVVQLFADLVEEVIAGVFPPL